MNMAKIDAISKARYGTGVLNLPPDAASWLADWILKKYGVRVYDTIWKARERMGKWTCDPQWTI